MDCSIALTGSAGVSSVAVAALAFFLRRLSWPRDLLAVETMLPLAAGAAVDICIRSRSYKCARAVRWDVTSCRRRVERGCGVRETALKRRSLKVALKVTTTKKDAAEHQKLTVNFSAYKKLIFPRRLQRSAENLRSAEIIGSRVR